MRICPNDIAVLYISDIMYIRLHPNQIWEIVPRTDGKHEVKRDCFSLVLTENEYRKYFNTNPRRWEYD